MPENNLLENYLSECDNNKSIDSIVKAAEDYKSGIRKEIWPTGFEKLDGMLDGGFHGSQLVCVGAISSLGKTSWVLQIASQIAEQGKDVLIFSLEMSRDELNAKTISRYSYIRRLEKAQKMEYFDEDLELFTTSEILKGDIYKNQDKEPFPQYSLCETAFQESVAKARAIAPHTFIVVGNNDISVDEIKSITENHIKVTGRKPIVIVDYLQIISPSANSIQKHYDVRRSTNDDITSLKVLARNNDIPIVVISAFNRASYTDPVSMGSFRESSGIEYSADVLFGLQYLGMDFESSGYHDKEGNHVDGTESTTSHVVRVNKLFEEMQEIAAKGGKQDIELKIMKNRNGSRGTLPFHFTPKYNYFEESQSPQDETSKNKTNAKKPSYSSSKNRSQKMSSLLYCDD